VDRASSGVLDGGARSARSPVVRGRARWILTRPLPKSAGVSRRRRERYLPRSQTPTGKSLLSPSPEIALTVLQLDFRIGGTYRFAYRVPGGQAMIVNGAIDPSNAFEDSLFATRSSLEPARPGAMRGLARCSRSTDHTARDRSLTHVQPEENPK